VTIEPETLMAYADGELDPLTAKRVERAITDDPALGAEVDRHRALTMQLRGAFASVDAQPVPSSVEAMLRQSAKVTPMPQRTPVRRWIPAIAASLVAGVLLGQLMPHGGDLAVRDGVTMADGGLARALGTQLASTQPGDAAVQIGLSFRNRDAALCRTFEQGRTAGIACSADGNWRIERLYGGADAPGGDYRQAGAPAAMMTDAQAMMAGEPLDAVAERAALNQR
jgi:hypothetical protein